MSQKGYKNLSYTATVPPFLARLRSQAPGSSFSADSDGPDPILAARRRPAAAKRSASEEAEDTPLVLDENGNVVNADVAADGTVSVKAPQGEADTEAKTEPKTNAYLERTDTLKKQETAAIGSPSRKRRAARVIGADGDDDQDKGKEKAAGKQKKAKKIKLSFDEEE
ncbi:hypothetical protein Cpir12675_004355 [Ceratocystis pirilliformis]|uniref:DUF4604 domain-containing protein n=1 Tax=Ceratocystis pirilliformis TaxID=259994 RepID=A0ABR3YWS0_9PEZI